jgi:hypothetical protein
MYEHEHTAMELEKHTLQIMGNHQIIIIHRSSLIHITTLHTYI